MQLELHVRDLRFADLDHIDWSGGPRHVSYVAAELNRRTCGEVDYLAMCGPNNRPIAIGGIDYANSAGAGTLMQFAVLPDLQSCGIGTMLIAAAEQRIRDRGLPRAELSVEDDNIRARALYEWLGYQAFGTEVDTWEDQSADGTIEVHETNCIRMRKELEGRP
jgi:ribosomal protein S18 acetylase RimI-like enzyme